MATTNKSPFRQIGIKKFIPGIAWFFVVLTLCCIPGYDLPKVDNWMIEINYDKLIHVGIFALLAFLFMYPVIKFSSLSRKEKLHYCIRFAMAAVVWGYTTEVIQKFFIPGRSYDLTDWLADSLGALVALIFCRFYFLKTPKTDQ